MKYNSFMKKIIIFAMIILSTTLFAKLNVIVSILPEKTFVKAIGKNLINVSLMVQPGSSPETYEPKPSQMMDISRADIYFSIGVEFEDTWLPKFANQNKNMKIINLSKGITKIAMTSFQGKKIKYGTKDPHIWTSPNNVKIIALNIFNTLSKYDSKNKNHYKENYEKFILQIDKVNLKIKKILKNTPKNTKFMVFHPAWGYFAKEYGLKQFPIEVEGKSPKPRELIYIMNMAKKEHIKTIFTQPEFSDKVANQIAKELNIKVIKATPLAPNWSQNLINFAKAIAYE